ncbi:MAG TPA: redoxin domain-containing protein [Pyrinomonadaceae bacterium]
MQIGETVQPFSGIGLSGERIEIDYSNNSKKRLFLYFAPSCKYCGQQFPDWKEMLKQISSDQIEVFGIVSENEKQSEVDNYLHSFDCDSDSATPLRVIFASTETLQNYKLNVTPTSLLISPNGKSEKVWTGKWNNNEKENAFALIKQ